MKTTIYLGPPDRENIERLRNKTGIRTDAGIIRRALELANVEPPETTRLGVRILQWAETLPYRSPREARELRELTGEMYRLVSSKESTTDKRR